MNSLVKYILIFLFHRCSSDWVSDWMTPVQNQFDTIGQSTPAYDPFKSLTDFNINVPTSSDLQDSYKNNVRAVTNEITTTELKAKLENTIRISRILADTLKTQIDALTAREKILKDAIVNGRFGVTSATVSLLGQVPRSYIIRDGRWTLCSSVIQTPGDRNNLFKNIFAGPRCAGQEVPARRDRCAFNSIIKYETIPTQRRTLYVEDDYLCLKTTFNNTLEKYLSVTVQVLNETCENGTIRSLADNILQCGIRTLTEYTYYPHRSATELPLEYCTEKDGSCKLIMAWHISNATIENFEFLKNEQEFKNYFIRSGQYFDRIF